MQNVIKTEVNKSAKQQQKQLVVMYSSTVGALYSLYQSDARMRYFQRSYNGSDSAEMFGYLKIPASALHLRYLQYMEPTAECKKFRHVLRGLSAVISGNVRNREQQRGERRQVGEEEEGTSRSTASPCNNSWNTPPRRGLIDLKIYPSAPFTSASLLQKISLSTYLAYSCTSTGLVNIHSVYALRVVSKSIFIICW